MSVLYYEENIRIRSLTIVMVVYPLVIILLRRSKSITLLIERIHV